MNLKSNMLKICVVIALIFMVLPAIAAEDVDDSVYTEGVDQSDVVQSSDASSDALTADTSDTASDEDGGTGDVSVDATATGSADLEIGIIASSNKVNVGDIVTFAIAVINNGPDTATNVVVNDFILGDALYIGAIPSQGEYDEGTWEVGDLEAGEYAMLLLFYQIIDEDAILLIAQVTSDTPDPNLDNNLALSLVEVEDDDNGNEIQEPDTMPAAGNPVALAILALMSIVGVSLKRKF